MKAKLFKTMLCAGMAGALLTGCMDNNDVYNPDAVKKQFEQNWEKQFGKIDPNQTWNTAKRVTANVNVPYINGEGRMNIYTKNPLEEGCKLLAMAEVNGGTASVSFDAPNAMDKVFVSIKSNGLYRVYGHYAVENGTINVTPTSSVAANTRTTCGVRKGNTIDLELKVKVGEPIGYTDEYNGNKKTFEEWEQYYRNFTNYPWEYGGPYVLESIIKSHEGQDGQWRNIVFDFSNPTLKNGVQDYYEEKNIELTSLNGVDKESAEPWTLGQGFEMFGPGSFFEEGKKYFEAPKYSTLYQKEGIEKLEKGFSITSKGGEIELPFVYGATQNNNKFGYVYYREGQDPLTQPHYILIEDAQPQNNIYFASWKEGTPAGNMQLSGWNTKEQPLNNMSGTSETLVYGTKYRLAFFGENHDQTATYSFPAGYKIVFFIYPNSQTTNYNYSVPELNKRIDHKNWNGTPSEGAVKCAAWTFQGKTFVGFEDGGADEDLNDIVFMAAGAFEADEPLIDVPSEDEPEPEAMSWILACEDLGEADDFDFNDIVFKVSHAAGSTDAYVTPLAAGGTLSAEIFYNNESLGEIHKLLGGDEGMMINTSSIGTPGESKKIAVPADFSLASNDMGGFSIKVKGTWKGEDVSGTAQVIEAPVTGAAPQMICVPGDWAWPTERTNISEAYPGFGEWGKDYNTNQNWYANPNQDYIVK